MSRAASSTAGHNYGHVSKRAASALAALRSLRHSYGYSSVARLASAAHHATLPNRTHDQQYERRTPDRNLLARS